MKKAILKVLVGTIIAEMILACFFVLIDDMGDLSENTLMSVMVVFLYSLPCLIYSKLYDDSNYKTIAIIATITVGGAALLNIISMWTLTEVNGSLAKLYTTLNLLACMFILLSVILPLHHENKMFKTFRALSIMTLLSITLLIEIFLLGEFFPDGFGARLVAIISILGFGSFIATLILSKIYKD